MAVSEFIWAREGRKREGHSFRAILLPLPYNSARYVQCNLLASLSSDGHTQTKMEQRKMTR